MKNQVVKVGETLIYNLPEFKSNLEQKPVIMAEEPLPSFITFKGK